MISPCPLMTSPYYAPADFSLGGSGNPLLWDYSNYLLPWAKGDYPLDMTMTVEGKRMRESFTVLSTTKKKGFFFFF